MKTRHTTITLPKDLRDELAKYRDEINVSAVCAAALWKEIIRRREIEAVLKAVGREDLVRTDP